MGIVQRSLDDSHKQRDIFANVEDTVTAGAEQIYHVPHPMAIQSAKLCAEGLSGSPTATLQIQRFVTDAGETQIALGAALALVAVGTSGPQSYTFSTTVLQAGDQVRILHGGANSAVDQLSVALVVKGTQDILSWDY